jgi:glutaredoxin
MYIGIMENSDYSIPTKTGFTIYTKSNCTYCDKVKAFLSDTGHTYTTVLCDDYLKKNKIDFLEFIEAIAGVPYNTFPMVFHNSNFVGGYNDTIKYSAFI